MIFFNIGFTYCIQDISEPENLMEEFEQTENNLISTEDNSNDENDVDDETMSGKSYDCIYEHLEKKQREKNNDLSKLIFLNVIF